MIIKENDLFVSQEKKIGLLRKWLVLILGVGLLGFLYPDTFPNFNSALFISIAVIYFLYTLYILFLAKGIIFRILWHSAFFVELVFLSFLIFYSNGLDSMLFLFYPAIIISNALVINNLQDYFLSGFVAHITYVFTLLVYYSSLNFYLETNFLLQIVLLLGLFAVGLVIIFRLQSHNKLITKLSADIEQNILKMETVSILDEPTGLFKLVYFLQRLTEEVSRAKRYKSSLCLVLLEVDYFENVSDKEAKPIGEAALKQVARILFRVTRDSDICCRWEGVKLAVILPQTSSSGGIRLAERIRKGIEESQVFGEANEPKGIFSVAIGIGNFPVNASSPGGLLKVTETALEMAIDEKKNRIRPHLSLIMDSPKKSEQSNEEISLEREVKQ